jgi:hypothetical protein
MNQIDKVVDRCFAKHGEQKTHQQNLPGIENTLKVVAEFEALIKHCLAYRALRLQISLLLLEANLLLFALRERAGAEQPTQKIETAADFEAALLGRRH